MTEAAATTTPDLSAIKEQVEFYFSDSNLPRDNHLKTLVQAEGADRYVEIAHILGFKRMQTLGATAENVKEALKDSEEIEMSEDGTKLRRKNAFDEAALAAIDARSIYAKRFDTSMDLDTLKTFWSKEGTVKSVRMRRMPKTKDFKGTVFVEFSSPEEAAQILAKEIEYNGTKLYMSTKADFLAEKQAESAKRKQNKGNNGAKDEAGEAKPDEPLKIPDYKPGYIISFKGAGAGIDREAIKAVLAPFAKVAFVDYSRDQETGTVRMEEDQEAAVIAEAVTKLNESADEKKIADHVLTWALVSGDDEKEYYHTVAAARANRRASGNKRQGGYHRGGDRSSKRARN